MPTLDDLIDIVKQAGLKIRSVKNTSVDIKSANQLVTEFDVSTERFLIQQLSQLFPQAGFLTEEQQIEQTANKEFVWVIDPIDGTTNFVHQIPVFCVSVALFRNNTPVLGVVYEINQDEMFSAEKGKGAFLNGKAIQVTQTSDFKDTLIATGFPYYDYERIGPYLKSLEYFMKETRGVRRLGSAAVDLAYVAAGRFDAFYEYSLNPWDVAAGILLVEEAGGKVGSFNNGVNPVFGKEIIACNAQILDKMKNVITSAGL